MKAISDAINTRLLVAIAAWSLTTVLPVPATAIQKADINHDTFSQPTIEVPAYQAQRRAGQEKQQRINKDEKRRAEPSVYSPHIRTLNQKNTGWLVF